MKNTHNIQTSEKRKMRLQIHFQVNLKIHSLCVEIQSICTNLCQFRDVLTGVIRVEFAEAGQVVEDVGGVVTKQADGGRGELWIL